MSLVIFTTFTEIRKKGKTTAVFNYLNIETVLLLVKRTHTIWSQLKTVLVIR